MTYFMTSSFVKFLCADSQRSRLLFPVAVPSPRGDFDGLTPPNKALSLPQIET